MEATQEKVVVSRQMRRHMERIAAKSGKQNIQTALNNVLWKIVMQNGGTINVPCSDLKQIPATAALKGTYDELTDCFIIVAGTNEPKIIEANNGLVF